MTEPLRVCRYCDQPITDPDKAVFLWHEPAMSGPGWNVYAHPGHAPQVKPDLGPLLLLARIRARKALRPNP